MSFAGATSPGGLSTTVSRLVLERHAHFSDLLVDVLSAALDSGLALSVIIIFFACVPLSRVSDDAGVDLRIDFNSRRTVPSD